MISQTAEYALRALIWLAQHQGAPRTVHEIAAATTMPPEYLSKVLQELARTGTLISQRGPTGGYRLARNPEHISVYDIVHSLSPLQRIHESPLDPAEHAQHLSTLHQLLDDAAATVESTFRQVSIADLLHGTRSLSRSEMSAPKSIAPESDDRTHPLDSSALSSREPGVSAA